MEEEDSGSEHVSSETVEAIGHQHVALITQDGTQQVTNLYVLKKKRQDAVL